LKSLIASVPGIGSCDFIVIFKRYSYAVCDDASAVVYIAVEFLRLLLSVTCLDSVSL